jgi:hypothetical protein
MKIDRDSRNVIDRILPVLFGGSNNFFGRLQLINRTDDSISLETVRNPIRLVSSSWLMTLPEPIGHMIDQSLVSSGSMRIRAVYQSTHVICLFRWGICHTEMISFSQYLPLSPARLAYHTAERFGTLSNPFPSSLGMIKRNFLD